MFLFLVRVRLTPCVVVAIIKQTQALFIDSACTLPAMEFLRDKFTLVEAAPGLSESFFADLVKPRPTHETLIAFKDWAAKADQHMTRAKARKNCPVAWIGIFVDQVGVAIVLHFTHGVQLRHKQQPKR